MAYISDAAEWLTRQATDIATQVFAILGQSVTLLDHRSLVVPSFVLHFLLFSSFCSLSSFPLSPSRHRALIGSSINPGIMDLFAGSVFLYTLRLLVALCVFVAIEIYRCKPRVPRNLAVLKISTQPAKQGEAADIKAYIQNGSRVVQHGYNQVR